MDDLQKLTLAQLASRLWDTALRWTDAIRDDGTDADEFNQALAAADAIYTELKRRDAEQVPS